MAERQRNLDVTTSTMDPLAINNLVVSMRGMVRQARVQVIHKLTKQIALYRGKKGTEQQVNKNQRKADRLMEEVQILKVLHPDKLTKYALAHMGKPLQPSGSAQTRSLNRVANHKCLAAKVTKFRQDHNDWRSLTAYLLSKTTGRRYKQKKRKEGEKRLEMEMVLTGSNTERLQERVARDSSPQGSSESEEEMEESNGGNLREDAGEGSILEDPNVEENVSHSEEQIDKSKNKRTKENKDNSDRTKGTTIAPKEMSMLKQYSGDLTQHSILSSGRKAAITAGTKVQNRSHEMEIKKISFDDLGEDVDDLPIVGQRSDGDEKDDVPNFLLTGAVKEVAAKKKNAFFMMDSDEEMEESEEGADENSEDDGTSSSDGEDKNPHRKSRIESHFLGTLSNRERKPTSHDQRQRGGWKEKSDRRPAFSGRPNKQGKTFKDAKLAKKSEVKPGQQIKAGQTGEKLHPSWEASRQRKQQVSQIQAFQGKKVTFDDDD